MSLINFAFSDLGCSIRCDAVSVDGYEITNILENDRGFMTAGFIKPPVDIILSFPYWIELFALDLLPKVSAQCTQVASVFVSEHEWDPTKAAQLQNYFKPCITLNSLSDTGDNFIRLSRSRAILTQPGGSHTNMNGYNDNRSADHSLQSFISQLPNDRVMNVVPFERNTSVMHKVKAIKIRLQKALNAGSLSLKQVRIWAAFSRHNPPSMSASFEHALQQHQVRRQPLNQGGAAYSQSLNHLLSGDAATNSNHMTQSDYAPEHSPRAFNPSPGVPVSDSSTRAVQPSPNTVGSFHVDLRSSTSMAVDTSVSTPRPQESPFGLPTSTEQAYGVPERFVDPITFHLMEDPVILPSKHIVDRSTITRHLVSHGTDPFTGLPMSAAQVLPDLALKADLDRYNSQLMLQQLKLSSSGIYSSRLLPNGGLQQSNANSSKSQTLGSVSLPNPQIEAPNYSYSPSTSPPSSSAYSSWLTNHSAAMPNDHVACQNNSLNNPGRGVKRRASEISPDMEDVYSNDEPLGKRAKPARLCGRCNRDITWGVAYPCGHWTCRGCVVQVPSTGLFACPTCSAQYRSHELQRVHLKD